MVNAQYKGIIKKVWVCGPPIMNEQFETILGDGLSEQYGLDFKTQVDLM